MLKRKGFTLAEVLITLGIIGVVAALTIPTLMKNTQDQEFKSAWKKQYSTLEQASKLYLQENSTFLGVTDYSDALQPYLKTIQYCGTHASTEGCWIPSGANFKFDHSGAAFIPNNGSNNDLGRAQGLILNDGTFVSTYYGSPTCAWAGLACGWIIVDVNGAKAPNTVGRDVYGVWVLADKIVPLGSTAVNWYTPTCSDDGWGCSATSLMN